MSDIAVDVPDAGSDMEVDVADAPYDAPSDASYDAPSDASSNELASLLALGAAFRRAVRVDATRRRAPVAAAAPARAPRTYVVNRRGEAVAVRFDTITERNEELRSNPAYGPELAAIDSPAITAEIVRRFRNGMTTRELDEETSATCVALATHHSDYEWLAARVHVSDLHKRTPRALGAAAAAIAAAAPDAGSVRYSDEFRAVVARAGPALEARLDPARDYRLRFFGFQTVARSYLLRPAARSAESSLRDTQPMERPQHLYARVALGIFVCQPDGRGHLAPDDVFERRLAEALRFYDALSCQLVSNATPTMLNAGTGVAQLSSCFQCATGDDLHALLSSAKKVGLISKWSGGVSMWLHGVRAEGAPIRKTGGRSTGLRRYLRLLNDVQVYVDQGGNRPGAFAIYLAVDHDDIFTFLALARIKGEEALREAAAADLKYALWVPDLFFEALEAQLANPDAEGAGDWYLFCPDTAPGLHLVYGEEYRALYNRYVAEGRYRRKVKAGDIIAEAFKTWAQVGVPYVLAKDAINRKSNMQNVAPICSSNLCVAGDTLVLTDRGQLPIASLCDCEIPVWNGHEWSPVVVRQTNDAAALVRVKLSNGTRLDCTPYHKFYAVGPRRRVREVRAGELRPGDTLESCPSMPLAGTRTILPHAYTAGAFAGAGYMKLAPMEGEGPAPPRWIVALRPASAGLAGALDTPQPLQSAENLRAENRRFELRHAPEPPPPGPAIEIEVCELGNSVDVPYSYTRMSKLTWLAGLCDVIGYTQLVAQTEQKAEKSYALCLRSGNNQLLRDVQLMVQTLACRDPYIHRLPGDSPDDWSSVLVIPATDLPDLIQQGFAPLTLRFPNCSAGPAPPIPITVEAVGPLPGEHATYCFNEPLRNRAVFNGVYTGQCAEITIPSWSNFDAPTFGRFHPDNAEGGEFGVCNLASIALESFIREDASPGATPSLDFAGIMAAAAVEARALNRVIDLNYNPTDECRRSNHRHRPIGIGIMGLADVLARLGLVYGAPEARALARGVAAAVYFGAVRESAALAEAEGPYRTFAGSPISEGRLQPDLWVEEGEKKGAGATVAIAAGWEAEVEAATGGAIRAADWADLRARCRRGVRNAYVTAYMPTATTSNIAGQNECFEPFTSNIYTRRTLAGEFTVVNRHLMAELTARGLWDDAMRRAVVAAGGSVQAIERVPADVRRRYRTAREVHPSLFVLMAAAMAPFICQSMSLNLFLDEPSLPRILRFLLEGWCIGLKTLMYYCHTKPVVGAQKSSVSTSAPAAATEMAGAPAAAETAAEVCSRLNPGACAACAL